MSHPPMPTHLIILIYVYSEDVKITLQGEIIIYDGVQIKLACRWHLA